MVNTRRRNYEIESSSSSQEQLITNNTLLQILCTMLERNSQLIQEMTQNMRVKYDELEKDHGILQQKCSIIMKKYKEKANLAEEYMLTHGAYDIVLHQKKELEANLNLNEIVMGVLFITFLAVVLYCSLYIKLYCV